MTPLRFANPSPSSGWIEDLHLQTVVHTRHTLKRPAAGAAGLARQDSELRHGDHDFGHRFGTSRRAPLGAADAATDLGRRAAHALSAGIPGLRALSRLLRALAC